MLPRSPRRRSALTVALAAPLLALGLTGCGGTDGASTAAVTTSASTATPAPTGSAAAPASSAPAATGKELPDRAAALGEAFSQGDYGVVWDMACPGAQQNATRDDFATTMSMVLDATLTNPTVLDDDLTDEARQELREAGIEYDDEALVRYDVSPDSTYPNPTMTAWFVSTDTGWLYCGILPDA